MNKDFFKKTRILDGGMGQELLNRGLKPKGTLWSAHALIDKGCHQMVIDTHLDFIKAGKPKHIITVASLFILINSLSGIIGQLTKNVVLSEIQNYWFLLLAVLIGGQLGNFLNLKIFPARILVLVTSCLVLFVAIRMGYKLLI